jgi:hypothetical protein
MGHEIKSFCIGKTITEILKNAGFDKTLSPFMFDLEIIYHFPFRLKKVVSICRY